MNKIKPLFFSTIACILLLSCGGSNNQSTSNQNTPASSSNASAEEDKKGFGKFTHVELTHPLDKVLIEKGKTIYDVKLAK